VNKICKKLSSHKRNKIIISTSKEKIFSGTTI